jgi:branched-chain amino acid transport system ATP-binding protein
VLIVEQNARLALNHANYAYVLEVGKLVMEGPAKELAANDAIAARYLGGH